MLARLRVPLLADIPDRNRRDGLPQWVVRGKHPVIPAPVPPGRWEQCCQPVKKLKGCQFDDTAGPGPRRLFCASPPADWADLVQVHDDKESFWASPDELPAINLHSL
jgi:hypothetical protein